MAVAVTFSTIPELFDRLTAKFADEERPMLMAKTAGAYTGITYSEARRQTEQLAGGLAALGLRRGDRVGIVAENRPEWVIADQAIALLGAVSVPVYPTMSARQTESRSCAGRMGL